MVKKSLKKYLGKAKTVKTERELTEIVKIIAKTLYSESDRGCVIAGASVLDDLLEVLLRSKFKTKKHVIENAVNPLFNVMAPLSTGTLEEYNNQINSDCQNRFASLRDFW